MNHYVEYDVNEELGKYCICVHCGSRNLGQKVFKYWDKIAKTMCISKDEMRAITDGVKATVKDKTILSKAIKEAREEYLKGRIPNFLNGENMYKYLMDVAVAQTYARINHETIQEQISEIYMFLSKGAKVVDKIYTTHNYVDLGDMVLRKGAVRSYIGERLIIPFNMRDGIGIFEGKSNEDWNCTAPHGCGRLYSRSKAKEQLSVENFKTEMAAAGIYTTTADASTLDEAPQAYKSYEEILELIEPTVNVLYLMKPKINIKASE